MMTVDVKGLEEALRFLRTFPEETRREHLRAINRAVVDAKTVAVQGAISVYTIGPANVVRDLFLFRASASNPTAILRSSGRPRALGNFKVTPGFTRKSPDSGFMAEVLRGGGGELSSDYFWLRFKSGFASLFRRSGTGKSALDPAYSPSTPQMIGNEKVQTRIERVTRDTLERVFSAGMNRMLARRTRLTA